MGLLWSIFSLASAILSRHATDASYLNVLAFVSG